MTKKEKNAVYELKLALVRLIITMDDKIVLKCINEALNKGGDDEKTDEPAGGEK